MTLKDLKTLDNGPLHPQVPALFDQVLKGEITRQQFLRTAALLGVTATSARGFVGAILGGGTAALAPEAVHAQETPRSGGVLRFACAIQELKDPALVTWIEASNVFRNSLEYLTEVDHENVTHPYLAESWRPSDDLKVWHFKLRQGIKWSNGDEFTTDDVEYNFMRWTDPASQSVNRTSFKALTQFEKLGPYEFKLHLDRPILAIREMLYAYTCAIVHRRFDEMGADWPKNPIGTGPFQLTEFAVSKIAKFKRRAGYWGRPAYLDELHYIDVGTDVAAHLAALQAGQVDILYRITAAELDLVKRLPNAALLTEKSAQTILMRMQTDQKPFDDLRVRQAVVLCADNQRMLDIAYRGYGMLGENHHVAPIHPEYFKLPPLKRDVAKAKQLLAEAGYAKGLDLELTLGNTQGRYEQDAAQILQQNCAEAGIRIKLNVLPASQYWPIWKKAPFSLTYWAHRPLGVMTLDLAYRSGADWNESHFASAEFDAALDQAMAILDPKERAQVMEKVEKIMQEACVMVQPFWGDNFTAVSKRVRGHHAHPAHYFRMDAVWLAR
jgi:peptide/nickel transport system substrate-binding protein